MIKPSPLKPGDSIALVAPARAVRPEELQDFKQWAAHYQWKVLESPHLYDRENQFSGSHEQRAADLHWAAQHPEVKTIWDLKARLDGLAAQLSKRVGK
ncbi:MAG: LD-carboxypeptidase [Bacteroidia bacterium]